MRNELRPKPLEYETPNHRSSREQLMLACEMTSWLALVLVLVVIVRAYWLMDATRLFSEGGGAYFNARFPFWRVWALAVIGAASAMLHIAMRRRLRAGMLGALLGNIFVFLYYLARSAG